MKDKINRYNKFLDDISSTNPAFFEAVTKGFNKIFTESTEDSVSALKEKVPPKLKEEGTPTEEFIGGLEEKGEISPEPKDEIPLESKK